MHNDTHAKTEKKKAWAKRTNLVVNEERKGADLLQKWMSLPYASLLCWLNWFFSLVILVFLFRSRSFSQLSRVSASLDAFFQSDIEAVLYGIVAASVQEFRNSAPSITENTVLLDDDLVLLF